MSLCDRSAIIKSKSTEKQDTLGHKSSRICTQARRCYAQCEFQFPFLHIHAIFSQVLVNRYKEAKYLAENVAKLTALVREAVDIARKAKVLVDGSTDIESQITRLLEQANKDSLVQITGLLVDSPVDVIVPPCLPFQLAFTLNTRPAIHHSGNYDICFNGEFYKNVAVRILRAAYPRIDEMYKALEEAELRYVQIETIKKSLDRVNNDMTEEKSSRRFHVSHAKHDVIDRYLLKNAERRIPRFTTKGDHTVMAFAHYSPWAAIRRSKPFAIVGRHTIQKYNFTSLQGNHIFCLKGVSLPAGRNYSAISSKEVKTARRPNWCLYSFSI